MTYVVNFVTENGYLKLSELSRVSRYEKNDSFFLRIYNQF